MKSEKVVHLIFCIVDHFEPFNKGVEYQVASDRVRYWLEKCPVIYGKHRDSSGVSLKHTWFYPPHLDHGFLGSLVGLCKQGFGEIEMHLHHNHMSPFPDTSDTLRSKILQCIDDYSRYGIFCLSDGNKSFGFIHGDWSLDNSRGNSFCGVNNELTILKGLGCYADFTFPSLGEAQPAIVNKIYYAKDNEKLPKSYNRGREVSVGSKEEGDLLLIPGIIGLRWRGRRRLLFPDVEYSNIDYCDPPTKDRIDYWVENALIVKGQPEWRFIKVHTHGAKEEAWDVLLGDSAENMFSYLETRYNDGKSYMVHYVTAREMFNIVKAAEDGKKGNPREFCNYLLPPYVYK